MHKSINYSWIQLRFKCKITTRKDLKEKLERIQINPKGELKPKTRTAVGLDLIQNLTHPISKEIKETNTIKAKKVLKKGLGLLEDLTVILTGS